MFCPVRAHLNSDSLDIELNAVDCGCGKFQQLLSSLLLLKSDETKVFALIFLFVVWLLNVYYASEGFKVILKFKFIQFFVFAPSL